MVMFHRVLSRATRCTTTVPAISIVVCHGGGSVWTSDSKVSSHTGIACAWREGSENITIYADDNTCIVTNSYGLVKVIDVFNEYGRASGARLNIYNKIKGPWLGRWRSRTDSPCGLTWVNTSLKIVGIYFGSENAKIQSWEEVTAKFKGILKKWEPRYLTLRGKMTVIGSLVASTLWHVVGIYPLTRECIDSLQTEIWKFVWSKKPKWLRRETCMSNGGLRIIKGASYLKFHVREPMVQ